ncbi:MAG: efflux RND transporter permease subunit [Gammaproteobacteria bacterium]|nr:efflux RND transporter permease subunit [Gammaproteobacteria bacterium]
MRLINTATERRVTILMFTLAIVLFGAVSLTRLKVNLLPELSYPTLTIRTELTGAAPFEIENLISKPVEEAVGVVKNVRLVRSISRTSQSDVVLEFIWGTDMDMASVDVREKLDILQLPLEAGRSVILRFDPSNEPILRLAFVEDEAATADDGETRLKRLRRYAEERLKTRLEAVEGVAAVKVSGGLEDEIQILVDQQKLSQLRLSVEDVANRIRAENVNLAGGRLEQGMQRFLVRTLNEYTSVEQIADTIISSGEGRPIFLRDIATVKRGYKEREAITRVDGRESIELAAYKEGDANTVQVAGRVNRMLDSVREELPDGQELRTIYDQSTFISQAIDQVLNAAIIGGLLAVMVLYLFLRDIRPTLIIGIAIPVSVIGTFLMMYATEITLNIMSLGGVALAVGLLVDNAIVVLENISRHREKGKSIISAARDGASEVAAAVTASTLTTVAVFFPMVFVSGVAGQLFRDQALTVTFALIFSLLVALTLIPMLASLGAGHRFADAEDPGAPNRFTRGVSWVYEKLGRVLQLASKILRAAFTPLVSVVNRGLYGSLLRIYPGVLQWSLRHRLVVVIVALLAFAASMSLVPRLGTELIPQLSQGEFSVSLRLAPGSPLVETDRVVRLAERAASASGAVAMTYSVAGTGNRIDADPVDAGEHTGSLSVVLKKGSDRDAETATISSMRKSLGQLPGVEFDFRRPSLFSFDSPLEVEISGFDLERLNTVSDALLAKMQESDRFADVRSSIEAGNPEIQITFDQERAAKLGLAVRDIADRVVGNVRGNVATRYSWRDRKIDVLVRSVDTRAASIDEIRRLIVNPGSERPVTLDAVANISVALGPSEIRRLDQSRVALVSANLAYGDLGTAVDELESLIAEIPRQAGVSAMVSGQNEEMQRSMQSMQFTLLLAVFLVYLVMASQFESLIHPLVILFTVPLALIGAVLALFITGTTINVVAFIGVIMLAGIVVNNAIVLVDLINQLRRDGMEKTAAIIEAGRVRLRPILMTTLTTILGLLPMAIGFGEGAEVRTPMAITVIGGLLAATLLTLVVIPVVYHLLDRKSFEASPAGLSVQTGSDA